MITKIEIWRDFNYPSFKAYHIYLYNDLNEDKPFCSYMGYDLSKVCGWLSKYIVEHNVEDFDLILHYANKED